MPRTIDIATIDPKVIGPQNIAGGPGPLPPKPDGGGGGNPYEGPKKLPLSAYRIAMLAGLAAILMMFAGLASAFIVRGMGFVWPKLSLPKTLWLSTALLLASSFVLQKARRAVRADDNAGYQKLLKITAALGSAFVLAQFAAWYALVRQGVYLQGNPHSSFFYMLTGLHAVHVLGGIIALSWLVFSARRGMPADEYQQQKRVVLADTVGLYWHFMDGLWVFLFALLLLV